MRTVYSFLLLTLAALGLSGAAHAQSAKTVLIINSYHQGYEWVQDHNGAIQERLADRANIHSFFMDTKRIPVSLHRQQSDKAYAEYERIRPDVVIITDDNALMHLGNRIASRGTPLVYLGINNNPRAYLTDLSLATGTLERPLYKRSIIYLKEILGKSFRKCLILFDVSTTSDVIVRDTFRGNRTLFFSGIETHIRQISNWEKWKQTVLTAKEEGYDALILGLNHTIRDDDGTLIDSHFVEQWTGANTPVPPFCFWSHTVGPDLAMGGLILTGSSQGALAAQMTARILNGESIRDIAPVTDRQGQFLFSRAGLRRWGITLPESIESQARFVP